MKFPFFSALIFFIFVAFSICQQESNGKYGSPVIGIDLGTTFSVVGVYMEDQVVIIPNEQGNRITPSVVSFTPSGAVLVGEAAKNNMPYNPENTLYDVKRLIGRKFSEVQKIDKDLFSYKLAQVDGRAYVQVKVGNDTKTFAPEEISALVLGKMKKIAEAFLNQAVKYAVITCPAYFNDAQRQATKDAGRISGLEVLRVINEPTAAALAYGKHESAEKNIMVYDLGGGTLDVSILTIDNGTFQVLSTSGDMHLGGEDFDLRVLDYFSKIFKEKYEGKDIKANKKSFQLLKVAVEKAKRILSKELETQIELEALLDGIDFNQKLTRAKFEDLNKDLFEKAIAPIRKSMADAKLGKDDIDVVVMVGGSTRIPKVQELVSKYFDGKKLELEKVNPDEAIGYGAAVQGAILNEVIKARTVILDVTPLSLGIETEGGEMAKIINRNTHIPIEKFDIFTTTGDYQTELTIPIYEGERPQTRYNRLLGQLELTDIPAARRGIPQIKVIFNIDKNGILNVTAEDMQTKKSKKITIRKGFLSSDEVKKIAEDASQHQKEDKEFEFAIQARRRLEEYVANVEAQLSNKNIANRIKSQDKDKIRKKLSEATRWMRENDAAVGKVEFYKRLVQLKKLVLPIMSKLTGEHFDLSSLENFETGDEDESVGDDGNGEKEKRQKVIDIVDDEKKDEL